MAVVFSGMFGLGIVIYTSISSDVHLDHILFGNMLGVQEHDLWLAGSIALLVSLLLLAKWRDLMMHAFDPAQAQASGLPVAWLMASPISAQPFSTRKQDKSAVGTAIMAEIRNAFCMKANWNGNRS